MLRGERDHRGGAAERCRHRRAVEIVGADDAGRGALLDMAMAVDAARQDQPSGSRRSRVRPNRGLCRGLRRRRPLMPISQTVVSAAVTTVPLRITRSNSLMPVLLSLYNAPSTVHPVKRYCGASESTVQRIAMTASSRIGRPSPLRSMRSRRAIISPPRPVSTSCKPVGMPSMPAVPPGSHSVSCRAISSMSPVWHQS